MKIKLDKKLVELAKSFEKPFYAVGGVVRNFLIDGSIAEDVDLAAPVLPTELLPKLEKYGFKAVAEYKRTGTVMFTDGKKRYEYTAFRRESYVDGKHVPENTEFTENIEEDAIRRDFKCNAVYYDIKREEIVDPLCGVKDIENKKLDTTRTPELVFAEDGLRLMRLARFAGELDFKPEEAVLSAALKYSDNIKDISAERVYAELVKILQSDGKYKFSSPIGHYSGLKILDKTRVLDKIIPELTDGRGMVQRADFHKYDVLEHSLRTVLYAPPEVRLGALLHDVGKPFCFRRDGYYYHHFEEGEKIAEIILKRLRADGDTIKQVKFLVKEHMVDLDCSMSEKKVRRFLVKNIDRLEELLMVKQADFRASLETEYTVPTTVKWTKILEEMYFDGTPLNIKYLKVSAKDLSLLGFSGEKIGKELKKLFDYAVINSGKNDREILIRIAKADAKRLRLADKAEDATAGV